MARLCERPGCSVPAEVAYGFDAEQLLVWLSLPTQATEQRGLLCRRHADAMVVPLGWMLDDRRVDNPQLFRPRGDTAAPAPRPRSARAVASSAQGEQLGLDVGADERAEAPADDGAVDPAAAWKPVFDQTDDLGGLLTANSPLLSRAFRGGR
jgi:hypothetical protein